MWEKYVQTSAKLLYVRLFCKNGTQNESEFGQAWVKFGQKWCLKCLVPSEMQSFYFGGHFLRNFFGQVYGNLGKNSSHPPNLRAPTPMWEANQRDAPVTGSFTPVSRFMYAIFRCPSKTP